MRKLITLILSAAMVAGLFGVAMADHHGEIPNQNQMKGHWYYPYIGLHNDYNGLPSQGFGWAKKAMGEVKYLDQDIMIIEADGSGDMMTFYLYENVTKFIPSLANVRVGSKVKVKSDDVSRANSVHVVPFHEWLAMQKK